MGARDGHRLGMNTRVSEERWREAQASELDLWDRQQRKRGWRRLAWPIARGVFATLGSNRLVGDDWNHWWSTRFGGYSFLPNELGDYIELGCGPYTNTRLITKGRQATRIVCSDPLIRHYVGYRGRWLAESYRRGKIVVDDHPVEEVPFDVESFDVVVLINVLDHVRDAALALEKTTGLIRRGGFLVLGQELNTDEDVRRVPEDVYHPIRLRRDDIAPHLRDFEAVLHHELSRREGRNPDAHGSTLIYAGVKQ
jgi:SAM-dependent methyltransferase